MWMLCAISDIDFYGTAQSKWTLYVVNVDTLGDVVLYSSETQDKCDGENRRNT